MPTKRDLLHTAGLAALPAGLPLPVLALAHLSLLQANSEALGTS
jgi:hypothetical protein